MSGAAAVTPEIEEITDEDIKALFERALVVYNDDINSFDHVIECFVSILGHTREQAEQAAILIHTKGRHAVKTGGYEELEPLATALLNKQINCEIE